MPDVLLATDADWIADECEAALGGTHVVHRVRRGVDVLPAVEAVDPDLVLLDLQIGNMGGMATCLAIRQEEGAGRLPERPVLMLLDRAADEFLAQRSAADGWLVKPVNPMQLQRAVDEALAAALDGPDPDEGADDPAPDGDESMPGDEDEIVDADTGREALSGGD